MDAADPEVEVCELSELVSEEVSSSRFTNVMSDCVMSILDT
jgi:hypothetical protein